MTTQRAIRAALWVLMFMVFRSGDGFAQSDPEPSPEVSVHANLAAGLGLGSLDMGGYAALTVHHPRRDIVLRVAGSGDVDVFSPGSSVTDVGVLYGRTLQARDSWTRAAIGPAVVRESRDVGCAEASWFFCSRYETETQTTLGLALQLDAVWAPWTVVGLGVTMFGDLNPAKSFAGLTFNLYLGRVR